MSDDQTRRGHRAEDEADPWLRHEVEPTDPADAQRGQDAGTEDDGWLRHDTGHIHEDQTHEAGPVRSSGDAHDTGHAHHASDAAHPQSPADEQPGAPADGPGPGAPAVSRGSRHAQRRDRHGPAPRSEDWNVYAAAAPAPGDETGDDRRRATRRHGIGAMLGAAGREFVIVVGMALVLSFVVKTWLLQAFYIPSGSMEDTLVLNDRVIVSKLTPGPVDLKRGDIVVFADPGGWLDVMPKAEHGPVVTAVRQGLMFVGLLPDDAENHLIKRVIGLPGDRVRCCDEGERLTVNGAPLLEPYLKPGDAASSQDFDITVPQGSVWVMGDHRSDSSDSRFHDPSGTGADGSVPQSLIVGRAVALVWPLEHLTWLSNPKATFAKVPAAGAGGQESSPSSTATPTGDGR